MEKIIPIPTDSIYKFYALFGLLLFVFAIGSLLYVGKSTNDLLFASMVEMEELKNIKTPSSVDTTKLEALEKRVSIAVSDKKFLTDAIGVIAAFALTSMGYGFWCWHRRVQPIQDEMAQLQLEKLRREVRGAVAASDERHEERSHGPTERVLVENLKEKA